MKKMRDYPAAESACLGMGTVITNRVFGMHSKEALRASEAETARLEKLLSRFLPDSDISRVNSMAGRGTVKVSDDACTVLSRSAVYGACCQGSFDVTIGPLVDLWSITKRASAPPDEQEIKKILPLVDYTGLILGGHEKTAGLKKEGQSIDLGGIAKGFTADKITGIFKKYGITSAYTNLGGNVAVIGAKPDGSPWRVGIRHPRRKDDIIGVVSALDQSVVTSGDYQRCFIANDGKRYHHILDPKTGYPAENGLISVTIVSDDAMTADALSTVIFTSGLEKGIEILRTYSGAEAILIDTQLKCFMTAGLKGRFQAAEETELTFV